MSSVSKICSLWRRGRPLGLRAPRCPYCRPWPKTIPRLISFPATVSVTWAREVCRKGQTMYRRSRRALIRQAVGFLGAPTIGSQVCGGKRRRQRGCHASRSARSAWAMRTPASFLSTGDPTTTRSSVWSNRTTSCGSGRSRRKSTGTSVDDPGAVAQRAGTPGRARRDPRGDLLDTAQGLCGCGPPRPS